MNYLGVNAAAASTTQANGKAASGPAGWAVSGADYLSMCLGPESSLALGVKQP